MDSQTVITLWELTAGQDYSERLTLLDNISENLSMEECEKVLQHIEEEIRKENAPKVLPFRRTLAPGMTDNVKLSKMLADKKLSPRLLDAFARHDRMPWKVSVSMNAEIQSETLDYLADYDGDCENVGDFMLTCIASHRNTTAETLTKLYEKFKNLKHKNITKILCAVAENSTTPQNIVEKLASHSQILVRSSAAMNENATTELLTKLSHDYARGVLMSVAENWRTPTEVLDEMSRTQNNKEVLSQIADNKNSSVSTLKRLMNNPDPDVYIAAKANLESRTHD